jgi:outer membrane lipoprotein-sorting protein
LIDRAVRGKGGVERLRGIRTVHAVSDTILVTGGQPVTIPTTMWIRYPGGFRVDTTMPGGVVAQVFDSGSYWIQDARGTALAPAAAAEAIRGNVQRDPIGLLLALADGRVTARRGPDVTLGGRGLPVLEVDLRPGGPLTLVLDPASGLILQERYPAGEGSGDVEETFSDYRDVDGLQVAFSVKVRHPRLGEMTRVTRQFSINVPLDPALFAKPS